MRKNLFHSGRCPTDLSFELVGNLSIALTIADTAPAPKLLLFSGQVTSPALVLLLLLLILQPLVLVLLLLPVALLLLLLLLKEIMKHCVTTISTTAQNLKLKEIM